MRTRCLAAAAAFVLMKLGVHGQDSLPQQTIVVFNGALPDSVALAQFYAQKRGIVPDHLVRVDCSAEEEITREEYDRTIAEPLRKIFQERSWWRIHETADGTRRVQASAIHFVAVIKGLPLKIKATATPWDGDRPGSGPVQNRNEACLDSELATLGFFTKEISGALNNPYFQSYRTVAEFGDAPILLVCRLDAPDVETVRRMITDAVETEKNGLWGRAFIDAAHNTSTGLALGDAWLGRIVDQLHKVGLPVIYDQAPETFPDGFPVSDCALYYGWYAANITGPFNQAGFRFLPGAIAIHIHSFSAGTLRDPNATWAGPLLRRGAAATIGNVYEPYLQLTPQLDILNDRLLHGLTFAEGVYMSTPVLSWMSVAVGDPLYRPYLNWAEFDAKRESKTTADWYAYHDFAVKNGRLAATEFRRQARITAARAHNAPMLEDIGLMEMRAENLASAIGCFEQARADYAKGEDVMRCVLEECDAWVKSGKRKRALDLARSVLGIVPDSPASQLLRKLETEFTPKPTPAATARHGGS